MKIDILDIGLERDAPLCDTHINTKKLHQLMMYGVRGANSHCKNSSEKSKDQSIFGEKSI